MNRDECRQVSSKLTERLVDEKNIIHGGWLGYRLHVLPDDASEVQVSETRQAFFAGAQHLFASIMNVLDSEVEPTERDLRRMGFIHQELESFIRDFENQHPIEKGH